MNELLSRTPETIAAEINSLKEQGRAVMLYYSIEIGRRLAEVRQLVPHGGWADWLKENVQFSATTAFNHIKVFQAYGDHTAALAGEKPANLQALEDLSYTQAVALLAIPDAERAGFLAENNVATMSSRELQQAIRERDEAIKRAQEVESQLTDAKEEARAAQVAMDGQQGVVSILETQKKTLIEEKNVADAKAKKLAEELKELKNKPAAAVSQDIDHVQELEEKLAQAEAERKLLQEALDAANAAKPDVEATYSGVEPAVPQEVLDEMEGLRQQASTAEARAREAAFRAEFKGVTDAFGRMLEALYAMPEEEQPRFSGAIGTLLDRMGAKIGQPPADV